MKNGLNSRERFLSTCKFEKNITPIYWDTIGFWEETVERWHNEGLPEDKSPQEYFKMDKWEFVPVISSIRVPLDPMFDIEVINEDKQTITYRNEEGTILKKYKSKKPMTQFLEFPVKTISDFEKIKFRLKPESKGRYPDWREVKSKFANRDFPLGLMICGAYGFQRGLLGMQNLSYMYYDNPALIRDILESWLILEKSICQRVIEEIDIDYIYIWEDMAFKNGPLISPNLFKDLILPVYKELINFVKFLGCQNVIVDSDGNCYSILPYFVEAGVNGFLPMEIAAGMDPLRIRSLYNKLLLWGGIDKRTLTKGKREIEKEVLSKVPMLLKTGGYIPSVDHEIPPDVSFENYSFFIDLIRNLTDKS